MDLRAVATEEQGAAELLESQAKADPLFREVETRGLIRPGITENGLNTAMFFRRTDVGIAFRDHHKACIVHSSGAAPQGQKLVQSVEARRPLFLDAAV